MICDVLVALVERDQLNAILPVVHRHALGHVARVLDGSRGEVTSQLGRAGVPVVQAPITVMDAPLLLMISAAARCPSAARLLIQSGIHRVWIVGHNGVWTEVDDSVVLIAQINPEAARRRELRAHVPVPGIRDGVVEGSRDVIFLTGTSPGAAERETGPPR